LLKPGSKFNYKLLLIIGAVATAQFAVLTAIGLTFGMDLAIQILYWFLAVPVIAYGVSSHLVDERMVPFASAVGLLLFYGLVLFMTYKHWGTDFYVLVKASFAWNALIFAALSFNTIRLKLGARN